ncbi:unnamed protein product [Symbiodinium natans]|uniref:Zinc-ribbon domain-containing protein n=1 Tax=Symbiodinium natans TaxID=878477 RepID=A0A812R6Y7_9DINO|nr:unnamed protein product [Symbiodinium natans]
MYATPTQLSTASSSPQQRLGDPQNMAVYSPRKRYGVVEKREPVEVSFGVGTRPNNGATLGLPEKQCKYCGNVFLEDSAFCRNCGRKREVEPTAYRRALNVAPKSEASEASVSPQRYWQVEPLTTSGSGRERPWRQQETPQPAQPRPAPAKEKPSTLGDDSMAATSGSARDSLRGLAAERDRLQRQVQEMRSDASNTRQETSQGIVPHCPRFVLHYALLTGQC